MRRTHRTLRTRRINEGRDIGALLSDLLAAYERRNESKIDDAWGAVFEETVPDVDNADTVGGEIVRAVNQIMYRRCNDGDCIGIDYGNESCNAPARYLMDTVRDNKVVKQIKSMWGYGYGYKEVYKLGRMVAEYLYDSLDLFSEKNHDDMWDWTEREDSEWGYEDEDEDDWD